MACVWLLLLAGPPWLDKLTQLHAVNARRRVFLRAEGLASGKRSRQLSMSAQVASESARPQRKWSFVGFGYAADAHGPVLCGREVFSRRWCRLLSCFWCLLLQAILVVFQFWRLGCLRRSLWPPSVARQGDHAACTMCRPLLVCGVVYWQGCFLHCF